MTQQVISHPVIM